ncbi:hypothetical protein N9772_02145 [Bacteroidia bacterium]|jgi:hypothetical protein|nr:hypothetical protein [Bacteroidia bacterium]
MKFKIITIAIFALIAIDCSATRIEINKERIGGDGSGNYDVVKRDQKDVNARDADGNEIVVKSTINIFCADAGPNSCPNNIAYTDGDKGDVPSLRGSFTLEAINAAQGILDNAEYQSSFGEGHGDDKGSIVTPDGKKYYYTVSWDTNSSNDATIKMTFEDAP